jgi:drug/metabolite transporter (DMT)-like permease
MISSMKMPSLESQPSGVIETGGHSRNLSLGISTALISILMFCTMDATVKWLGATYPVQQIMFFRCSVAFIPILFILHRAGGIANLRTRRPWLHLVRSIVGIMAMSCAFYGFTVMPLADASAIFYTVPLVAVAFSVPILGEKVGIRRWLATIIGLIGVLIIIRPGGNVFSFGGIIMLAATIFVGLTTNIIRMLNATDPAVTITFYFTLTGTVVSALASFYLGWITPDLKDAGLLICVGLLGGIAQYALTLSFRYSEVGIIAPFKYLSIVIGGVIGFVIWSEVPDRATLVGITIILSCGIYSMHRETKLARESDIRDKILAIQEK